MQPNGLGRAILLAVLSLSALAVPAQAAKKPKSRATATAVTVPADFFGVNGNVFGREDTDVQVAAMARAGVRVVRNHAYWKHAEPLPPDPVTGAHHYRWDTFDAMVTVLARHGIEFSPVIAYSTTWASPGVVHLQEGWDKSRVRPGMRMYTDYAVAFARRYGRDGEFWRAHPELPQLPVTRYEIWNEQNDAEYWQPVESAPEDYMDLYLRSRAELKKVDPRAVVLVGGLVQNGAEEFLRRMAAHRPKSGGRIDGIGYHIYAAATADGAIAYLRGLQTDLERIFGRAIPVELNEVGWSRFGMSEADRYREFLRLARDLPHAGVNVTRVQTYVWYSGEVPSDWNKGLGTTEANAKLLPAAQGYAAGIAAARAKAARAARAARAAKASARRARKANRSSASA